MSNSILHKGENGNVNVTIFNDGTTIREYDYEPLPSQPLSLDMKITNKCNNNCAYCHEQSNERGNHADLSVIKKRFKDFEKGTEIAIGGGDIFLHPQLEDILVFLKSKGCIVNTTVNEKSLFDNVKKLQKLQKDNLIYGIGISIVNTSYNRIKKLNNFVDSSELENIVYHVINGIHDIKTFNLITLLTKKPILILGYKKYGNGITYFNSDVEKNMKGNLRNIKHFLENVMSIVSFDNNAIEQLGIRNIVDDSIWDEKYMGDEGQFSMYYDAVEDTFAINSTSIRKNCGNKTIKQLFLELNN